MSHGGELDGSPHPVPPEELMKDVQADILKGGIPKRFETFYFFHIPEGRQTEFCQILGLDTTLDLFSSASLVANFRKYIEAVRGQGLPDLPMAFSNIAFSATGLAKMQSALPADSLGLNEDWMDHDKAFFGGMKADAEKTDPSLGFRDPVEKEWNPEYKSGKIDGVFLVAGSDDVTVRRVARSVETTFGLAMQIVKIESGAVRPKRYKGYEHFGYRDNISQPSLEEMGPDNPKFPDGSVGALGDKWNTVPQSMIVVQDADDDIRPKWTTHGSFMVFRKLERDVKAFRDALAVDAKKRGWSTQKMAAKVMGRWQNGCPVMVNSQIADVKEAYNNQFDFRENPRPNPLDAVCPIGAHIRKMNPHRAQQAHDGDVTLDGRIIRRGIPYGTEFSVDKGSSDRGLHFVCYQSRIEFGFRLLQMFWANFDDFPAPGAGVDLMTGNLLNKQLSQMAIHNDEEGKSKGQFEFADFNRFVKPKGGEYFFTPSITALKNTLSLPARKA